MRLAERGDIPRARATRDARVSAEAVRFDPLRAWSVRDGLELSNLVEALRLELR